ncbi:zinc finger and BTB domain-containing protein 49-like [Centruroides sculpturatus]|uniref:zinc finger and BTB domain-containing protein 49-like n=1 Tax=Centruroides sculpturatus TaxID=218467 RepID=UPI000C6CA55A|nr:zinc finger and BTB domain-containing protein 49-like [Centruroides sculpturatus]
MTFSERSSFIHHQASHAEDRHECQKCGKEFFCLQDLQLHEKTQHEARLYVCEICNATFEQRETYMVHQIVHQIEQHNLQIEQEKNKHASEQSHRCLDCQQVFNGEVELRKHGEEKHRFETFYYQCRYCKEIFADSDTYKSHRREHFSHSVLQELLMRKEPSLPQNFPELQTKPGTSSAQTLQEPSMQASPLTQIVEAPRMQARPSSTVIVQNPQIQATLSSQILEAPRVQAGPSSTQTLQKSMEPRMQAKPPLTQTLDEPKIRAETSSTQSLEKLSMPVEPLLNALLQELLKQAGFHISTILQKLFMKTGSSLIAMLQEQLMQTSPSTIETLIKAGMQAGPFIQNRQEEQSPKESTTQTLHSLHDSAQTSNKENIQARPFSTEISEESMMQLSSSTEFSQVVEPFTEILPTFHDSSIFSSTQMSDKKGKQFPHAQILLEDWTQAGPLFTNISEKGVIQEESFSSETSEKVLMHAESLTETVSSFHYSFSTETTNKKDMQAGFSTRINHDIEVESGPSTQSLPSFSVFLEQSQTQTPSKKQKN